MYEIIPGCSHPNKYHGYSGNFFEKVLGFKVIERGEQLIGFETGSFRFHIDRGESYGPVFELYAPDLEQAKRTLVENGCRIEVEYPKIPRCYIRDPFGLIFNLAEKQTYEWNIKTRCLTLIAANQKELFI